MNKIINVKVNHLPEEDLECIENGMISGLIAEADIIINDKELRLSSRGYWGIQEDYINSKGGSLYKEICEELDSLKDQLLELGFNEKYIMNEFDNYELQDYTELLS